MDKQYSSFASRLCALVVCGSILAGTRLDAQEFSLSVTSPPSPAMLGSDLTYTIVVTNLSLFQVQNVFVTNTPSTAVDLIQVTVPPDSTFDTNASGLFFHIAEMDGGEAVPMQIIWRPQSTGLFTNRISVTQPFVSTNIVITDIVTQIIGAQSDLAVSIIGPDQPVLVNDWMTYRLIATNLGPAVSNVVLSNTLPAGTRRIRTLPATQSATFQNNVLVFPLGTLDAGSSRVLDVTVQPTNTGTLTFSAAISATGFSETNTANDTASIDVEVGELITGQLVASNISEMVYSRQTGLLEQMIRVSNIGTGAVASARVIVTGLTNRLYNASGTNATAGTTNGNPFVVYGTTLEAGNSVDLLLEYFVPTKMPIPVSDTNYIAVGAPAANLSVPGLPAGPDIEKIVQLSNGRILIEFPAVLGTRYTIVYSPDMNGAMSSNAFAAQPSVVAPANRVQWIDYGPPKTLSAPPDTSSRFYHVLQNP